MFFHPNTGAKKREGVRFRAWGFSFWQWSFCLHNPSQYWENPQLFGEGIDELDLKTKGPIYMDLVELARMYHAKGELNKSNQYFNLAKNELDKLQADTRDAIAYANILAEYAVVLSALGKHTQATPLKKREKEIRDVFKGRTSSHKQTPYGKFCDQKSLIQTSS